MRNQLLQRFGCAGDRAADGAAGGDPVAKVEEREGAAVDGAGVGNEGF